MTPTHDPPTPPPPHDPPTLPLYPLQEHDKAMFSFLSQGPLGELLAPVKAAHQQLHQAIEDGQNDKARQLIQEGVYYHSPDSARGGAFPIHTACQAGNQEMINMLLEMGADMESKDKYGNGLLHAAAKGGKLDTVKFLLGRGADVSRRNTSRQTAYDVAESHIVRQYLLPLQLRAEPEPATGSLAAVHNPDVIRDYSNLAPPPTAPAYSVPAAPPHHHPQGPPGHTPPPPMGGGGGGHHKSMVDRPIAADGFHCSVGNPELAAKYGHTKAGVHMAPPPSGSGMGGGPDGGAPRPQANPTQYSAFAAYGGRPPPRYVTYNAMDNTSVPFVPTQGPPQGGYAAPPHMMQSSHFSSGSNNSSPVPPSYGGGGHSSGYAPSPPLPGPPPNGNRGQGISPVPSQTGYRGSPLPPPPPLPPSMLQPPAMPMSMPQPQQLPSRPSSSTGGIPTLPAANTISVFQPLADNGEDTVTLDG